MSVEGAPLPESHAAHEAPVRAQPLVYRALMLQRVELKVEA